MGLQPVVATPGAREEALQTSASTGMETGPAAPLPAPAPAPGWIWDGNRFSVRQKRSSDGADLPSENSELLSGSASLPGLSPCAS